ncbi:ABC transporter ATP-binding protein [Candidatus Leptofilum sp.]|uniref:ABC transporter ATP-binding protein n=1 Tax=Candidatus Leptofilum sp. TaxID=3241576 RepID=UPI003B5CA1A9
MNNIVLQTDDLSKNFGAVTAVQSVNLRVQQGEVFGFLGPNGAGKTTTIGMVLGLIHPSAGRITLFDKPVMPSQNGALKQVGSLVGAPSLIPYLTARKNLQLVAKLHDGVDDGSINEVLELVGLTQAAERKVAGFSTGMKQRLGLGAALLHRPSLIILDEPTNGLDPAGMREVRTLIRQLADDGITIFLSSHLLHEVEQVCDRIAVIRQGEIVAQGAVEELLNQSEQSVRLKVKNPDQAAELLAQLPQAAIVTNGGYVQVSGIESETAVAHLAQNGIIPSEVITQKSDLESLFLELTK